MIHIDPEDGAIRVEFPHGEATTIEGLAAQAVVERGVQQALFLDHEEAETLQKMIDYILENVKVRPESQEALRAIRPRLDELFRD